MQAQNKQYPSDEAARRMIVEVGRHLHQRGYVASNDGNISCKVSENTLWTTPTGVSKGFLTEDMLVKTDMEGRVLEGRMEPSSELRMHLRVYRENSRLEAVVHAHPLFATTFACAGMALDSRILPEGVVQLGVVPCAPFAMPGTEEVPDSIAPYVRAYNAVLLGNHGALTWGEDLMQAYMRMESVEFYAQVILYSKYIVKQAREFSEDEIERLLGIRAALGIMQGGKPS